MPGEMRAALNIFFYTTSLKDKEAKFLRKIWAFLEKIKGSLFFRFDDCVPFEGRPGANVFNSFLLNTILLGSSGYF